MAIRILLKGLGVCAALAAFSCFAASPAWSLAQGLSLAASTLLVRHLLGGWAAGFVCVGLAAARGCNPYADNAFQQVLLPLVAVLSGGGLLACVVVRNPRLGRRIEHGPFGPGI